MAHHPIAGSIFGLGRSPGVGKWQPTPVFLPGKSDGQSSLVGYSPWGCQRVGHDWAHTHTSSYKALPQQNDPSLTLWGQLWFTNKTGIFFFFFFTFPLAHPMNNCNLYQGASIFSDPTAKCSITELLFYSTWFLGLQERAL